MAVGLFRPPDTTGQFLYGKQLFKSRSIAQTALTAANLTTTMREVSFAESTVEFNDVSMFSAIRVEVWGTASNNDAPVIDLYCYDDNGDGWHSGTITLAYGNFTSAATTGFHASANAHRTIKDAFASGTAYRGCDTYTETADYDGSIVVPGTQEADFPGHFIWSFANTRPKWAGILVTTLAGTNLGAIYKPLGERSMLPYGT